jgi:hypothetical protein
LLYGRGRRLDLRLEMRALVRIIRDELKLDPGRRRRAAVLGAKRKPAADPTEIEGAICPCVQVTRPTERLAAPGASVLSHVVDDGDRDVEGALQISEIREELGDIGSVVLVSAMEAHERIEEKEPGRKTPHGVLEAAPVTIEIEPKTRRGDDIHRNVADVETATATEAIKPLTYLRRMIFREVHERLSGLGDVVAAETASPGCNREREIEPEPSLSKFRDPCDEADCRPRP